MAKARTKILIQMDKMILATVTLPYITVDILTGPSNTGLCKVAYGRRVLVRHVDRLEPLDDAAREMIKRS